MPAESANGRLARKAMQNEAMALATAVAVNTAPASMPASERMPGLTARM